MNIGTLERARPSRWRQRARPQKGASSPRRGTSRDHLVCCWLSGAGSQVTGHFSSRFPASRSVLLRARACGLERVPAGVSASRGAASRGASDVCYEPRLLSCFPASRVGLEALPVAKHRRVTGSRGGARVSSSSSVNNGAINARASRGSPSQVVG